MKIAITGGIGTGKSTVIDELQKHMKDHIFESVDDAVANSYEHPKVIEFLEMMGVENKAEMSDIFFNNPAIRDRFEAIANPIIAQTLNNWLTIKNIVVEFPLLFRRDFKEYAEKFDLVISITAPHETRVERVQKRNKNFTIDKIEDIIMLQPDQEHVDINSDIVFENNVPLADFTLAIENLYEIIDQKAAAQRAKERSVSVLDGFRAMMPLKIGLVPGSFDPIQRGHLYVIEKALSLVDRVRVVIAYNDAKKSFFQDYEKAMMITNSIIEVLGDDAAARVDVDFLPKDTLLITHAQQTKAKFLFRGLRSGFDYDYEHSINAVQKDLDRGIETIFIMTPSDMSQVSSSLVKSLARFPAARPALEKYVTSSVMHMMDKSEKKDGHQ